MALTALSSAVLIACRSQTLRHFNVSTVFIYCKCKYLHIVLRQGSVCKKHD